MRPLGLALLAMMLGAGREPDPSSFVARLGSPKFAEREAAARALVERGRAALPALRRAREDRDPEVRARVGSLVDRIESELLVRPTTVALDYGGRPLPEVVRDLAEQSGLPISLDPDLSPAAAGRLVSLRSPGPVPFWRAIDDLCRASGLRADVDPQPDRASPEAVAGLVLSDAARRAPPPACDSGPFRVKVQRVDYERHRDLDPPAGAPEEPAASELFQVQLQVLAEPRILVGQAGAPTLDAATDDQGQSLRPDGTSPTPEELPGLTEFTPGPALLVPVSLRYPRRPGRLIRVLRGRVPLVVAARQPDPLVVPLAEAAGKTFRRGGVALVIDAIRSDPNEPQATIELTLRPGHQVGPEPVAQGPGYLPTFLEHQFEVTDARGRPLLLFSQERSVQPGEVRLSLILSPGDGADAPARLRYYALTRARTLAEFAFEDIPMD